MKNETGGGNSSRKCINLSTLQKLARFLLLLTCYFTFEPISVRVRAVPASVFNQSDSFFPDNLFEMSGGMTRFINTKVSFQFDRRFPLALLVLEATTGDPVGVVRFE